MCFARDGCAGVRVNNCTQISERDATVSGTQEKADEPVLVKQISVVEKVQLIDGAKECEMRLPAG